MSVTQSTKLEIECRVIAVLSDHFSSGQRNIDIDSRLVEDLYIDSMSLVEVVMALNEMFGVELPTKDIREWNTVACIVYSVQSRWRMG